MNCNEVREMLQSSLADHPSPDAQTHLASCPACRAELAEWKQIRLVLDAVPVPAVSVDVSRVVQQAMILHQRRGKRWRRVTFAVCGFAAALLLVVLLRLEIRVDSHQLVFHWGEVPAVPVPTIPPTPEPIVIVRQEVVSDREMGEQLRLLRETVHALAGSLDTRDARLLQAVNQFETRLDTLQLQDRRRWIENDRYMTAMYKRIFPDPKQGVDQ